MSNNNEILTETSLDGLVPAATAGSASTIQAYAELIQYIQARCGPDAAALFAEPVLPARPDPANPTLTWYTSLHGQMIELDNIDDVARAPVVSALKTRLAKLKPLLESPDLGPKIASWLFIPSEKSILAVGGNPVLVNWGYLPADVAASPSKRESHFAATIGRYAPDLSVPPFTAEDQASYTARINRRASASEARSPALAVADPATNASTQATAVAPSIDRAKASRGWVPPLVAALIAASVLMFLLLPGALVYPDNARDHAAREREAQILRDGNRTLEEKLRQLEDAAHERVCRAPDGKFTPVAPGLNEKLDTPLPGPVAPPPNRVQVQPPGTTSPMPADQLFEAAVVFIYGPSAEADGVSSGSGFFISATQVVTNRHVVEGIQRGKISLTNKKLGKALPARLVAVSDPDPSEEKSGMSHPDLAVLEVEPGNHAFMRIGPSPTKMQDVWAIGYPGYITYKIDSAETKRLLSGDLNAAPDSTIERGYVTTKPEGLRVAEIVHSAKIAPGNSGGPLADLCGRVVGVNTLLTRDPDSPISTNIAQDPTVLTAFLSAHGISAETISSTCNPSIAAEPLPAGAPTEPQNPQPAPGGNPKSPPPNAK